MWKSCENGLGNRCLRLKRGDFAFFFSVVKNGKKRRFFPAFSRCQPHKVCYNCHYQQGGATLNKQRIAYVVFPFSSMVLALFICYWLKSKIRRGQRHRGRRLQFCLSSFNDAVPFWAWTLSLREWLCVLWPFAFFYIGYRSKDGLYKIFWSDWSPSRFSAFGISSSIDVQAWRETSGLFDPTRTRFYLHRNDS
jgi:hypothetical protein